MMAFTVADWVDAIAAIIFLAIFPIFGVVLLVRDWRRGDFDR
jgi:hypothetical protein